MPAEAELFRSRVAIDLKASKRESNVIVRTPNEIRNVPKKHTPGPVRERLKAYNARLTPGETIP